MPVGKPLHLRLFLEGEEVPVIAAQVQINMSAPATASIQIIPLDTALDFLPRTMVHLFFLDSRVDASTHTSRGTYRLLFSGEVIGFAYSQTPASRGLVLQCIDFSNYWDSAHVMAISYGPGGNAFTNQGSINGAAMGIFSDIPGQSAAEHLVRWLRARPVTPGLTGISGLAGGVIHVLEAMGGVPGHFKGINDFFTIAELRCRLLSQITAEENDNTAARVLAVGVFEEWLKSGIEQVGGNVTFRDVMKLLFQHIYYEFVPNPAPKFDDAGTSSAYTTQSQIRNHPTVLKAKAYIVKVVESLSTFGTKQEKTTETKPKSAFISYLDETRNSESSQRASILANVKVLNSAIDLLATLNNKEAGAIESITEASVTLEQFAKRPVAQSLASYPISGAITLLKKAIDSLEQTSGTIVHQNSAASLSARLRTQIVRPDCWFSSPPACNVIFPEMYAQLTYDRNFLQETTRLLVAQFNTLVGRDHLLAKHILAPFAGYNDAAKQAKYKGASSYRILMDHEVHVGIIPKSEWIPNTAGISKAVDAEQLKKVSNGRLDWLMKAALFHFFKYRFAARQLSIAGRFNPFLVCGFPGAVITRPYTITGGANALRKGHSGQPVPDSEVNDVIHQSADIFEAPCHFIGLIGGIQHSIDQSGGVTSATLHHVRKHRGIDDEFINLLRKTDEGSATRVIKVVLNFYDVLKMATTKNANTKPLALLFGVTPQVEEATGTVKPGAKSPKSEVTNNPTQVTKVQPTAEDVGAAIRSGLSPLANPVVVAQHEATFEATQVLESDSNSGQSTAVKDPPRTTRGPIAIINRTDVLVPKGATKVKINEKKGLYGGKIVGVEILNAKLEPVSFNVSSKAVNYTATTVGATGVDNQTLAIPSTSLAGTKTVSTSYSGVAFTSVIVYEEVTIAASGSLPIEEILRPSWFSAAYSNQNIGDKIYRPFFGCGAVVDGLRTAGIPPSSTDASPDADPVDAKTTAGDLMKRLESEEASKRANSVEKALNILGYEYGQVKSQGMDVDTFIRDYTERPIATFQDIFGDIEEPGGLQFTITDSKVGGDVKVKPITVNGITKTPRVGFHTGATHPDLVGTVEKGGKLVGLTTDLQAGFTRVGGIGATEPLVQSYDVRPAKKARVMAYKIALSRGPGFRGG